MDHGPRDKIHQGRPCRSFSLWRTSSWRGEHQDHEECTYRRCDRICLKMSVSRSRFGPQDGRWVVSTHPSWKLAANTSWESLVLVVFTITHTHDHARHTHSCTHTYFSTNTHTRTCIHVHTNIFHSLLDDTYAHTLMQTSHTCSLAYT